MSHTNLQIICNKSARFQFNPLTTVRGIDYTKYVLYLEMQLKKMEEFNTG